MAAVSPAEFLPTLTLPPGARAFVESSTPAKVRIGVNVEGLNPITKLRTVIGRSLTVPAWYGKRELVSMLRRELQGALDHEVDEWLQLGGVVLFHPHRHWWETWRERRRLLGPITWRSRLERGLGGLGVVLVWLTPGMFVGTLLARMLLRD